MKPFKEKGPAVNVPLQVVCVYKNSFSPRVMQEPFEVLRRAYLALEEDQDDDQRRIAFLKARMVYRRSIQQGELG